MSISDAASGWLCVFIIGVTVGSIAGELLLCLWHVFPGSVTEDPVEYWPHYYVLGYSIFCVSIRRYNRYCLPLVLRPEVWSM